MQEKTLSGRDWGGIIFFVLIWIWAILTSLGIHWGAWIVEQFLIIEELPWPIWLWPLITLVQFVLLVVPLWPLALFWRRPRYRAVFQTCALAALYLLCMIPARFAPIHAHQLALVLQIVGSVVYLGMLLLLVWLRHRRGGTGFVRPRTPFALPALALVPLLLISWIWFGALGSGLDILLNLAAALAFGLAVGATLGHVLLPQVRAGGRVGDFILGGFAVCASLTMMGSALGFNGLQLFLMIALPALGWMVIGVSQLWHERAEQSWLLVALLIGMVVAGPMLFVDPDELLLVLNLESRDVWFWAFWSALSTVAVGLGLSVIWFFLRGRMPFRFRRGLGVGVVVVLWLPALLIYFLAGQPGFHGDRLFVIWSEQADLSAAPAMEDYVQRRQFVYRTLVDHANTTQQDVRRVLDLLHVDYTPYYLVNAMEVDAGPLMRLWLASRPEVDRVLDDPVLRPLPAPIPPSSGAALAPTSTPWNLELIGADRVWQELGVTGEGIVIGQSDSGAQMDHPELRDTYRGRAGQHDYNWLDPWYHTAQPTDIGGHGTHTLGTMVGQTVGVAPGAEWYACVNLARNLGNPALYLDCMQFMLAPFPQDGDPFVDGDPARGAHVINNSWGCPDIEGCDPGALVDAVRGLRAAGVFVVVSAGNAGDRCGSVADPLALYDESFSVGAVDSSGGLAFFSSRGPVTVDESGRTKPDLVAPGVDVLSAYPGGTYYFGSGTSMAGPHVTGVVALMWSANPDLIGDIERTEQILIETTQPYDYARHGYPNCSEGGRSPNNAVGFGIVDAYAAVKRALEVR